MEGNSNSSGPKSAQLSVHFEFTDFFKLLMTMIQNIFMKVTGRGD
jgi:hypothetical protein